MTTLAMDISIQSKNVRKRKIKIFKAKVENQLDRKIKVVRSASGGSTKVDIPLIDKFLDLFARFLQKKWHSSTVLHRGSLRRME